MPNQPMNPDHSTRLAMVQLAAHVGELVTHVRELEARIRRLEQRTKYMPDDPEDREFA